MRCTILKFYIYLPVLFKWWHEIVTAVRVMPWRAFGWNIGNRPDVLIKFLF